MYKVQELMRAQELRIQEREDVKKLRSDDVLIKTKVAGICGSDLEYYKHGFCASFIPQTPLVLGHEFSGEIVDKGSDVTDLDIGDSVVINPAMPCHTCKYCIKGDANFCENMKFIGSASCFPHLDGAFAEFVTMPAKNCLKFDRNKISWGEAALVEPLMVAVAAVLKIDNLVKKDVVVFGGGTIGQLILAVLTSLGARRTTLIDIRASACSFAMKHGANYSYHPQEIGKEVFDVCIESSGSPQALIDCYKVIAKKGTLLQVGTITEEVTLPANTIMNKELTVKGSFRYKDVFLTSLDMIESKRLLLKDMITHTVDFLNLPQGFDLLLDQNSATMKVQIKFD